MQTRMQRTFIRCSALALALLGCEAPSGPAKSASTASTEGPKPSDAASADPRSRPSSRLDNFVARLQRVSSSAQLLKEKPSAKDSLVFALAVDADGKVASGPRPSLAFRFESVPYKEGMPGGEDGFAALNAKLDVDARRPVVIAMAFTGKFVELENPSAPEGADKTTSRFESVRILLARDPKAEPSAAGRGAVAKLWNLGGEDVGASYERAAFDAIVLGTRLKRNASPPSFSDLGAGTWTLLRLVEPSEAYLAVDWASGVGEFFPRSKASAATRPRRFSESFRRACDVRPRA